MTKNIQFLTIGHRLSKQLLSDRYYAGNYSEKGTTDLESAFGDYYYLNLIKQPLGYSVEKISIECLDILNGPDFVVGTQDERGYLKNAYIVFIYDDIDTHNDQTGVNGEDIYQSRIVFDDYALNTDTVDISAKLLKDTLTLLTMKSNFDAFVQDVEPEMILGIHSNIIENHPQFSQMMDDFGFTEDRRNVEKEQIVLYHIGTAFSNPHRQLENKQ